jgi:hypothetical protein
MKLYGSKGPRICKPSTSWGLVVSFVLRYVLPPYRLDYFVGVNRRRHKLSDGEKERAANRNPTISTSVRIIPVYGAILQNHTGVRFNPSESYRCMVQSFRIIPVYGSILQNHTGVRCNPSEAIRHSRGQQTAPPTAAFPRGFVCHLPHS